ncbi:hypothetical protein DPMN_068514 [Dreissena polymorpha]|uniref:Uncharacterized protein n=1 Tax=Dreissena polymorpha TaxID=45954 RepID=A0A9D4BU99_DREPO|nr:hypothetical protein DPMN_068514 [Dreissena polymorpha]
MTLLCIVQTAYTNDGRTSSEQEVAQAGGRSGVRTDTQTDIEIDEKQDKQTD